jgi:hypothetical protein
MEEFRGREGLWMRLAAEFLRLIAEKEGTLPPEDPPVVWIQPPSPPGDPMAL